MEMFSLYFIYCILFIFTCAYIGVYIHLFFSEVSNGSSNLQENAVGGSMLSLTNKTAALSMCSDPVVAGSEMQKNGVVHSCS